MTKGVVDYKSRDHLIFAGLILARPETDAFPYITVQEAEAVASASSSASMQSAFVGVGGVRRLQWVGFGRLHCSSAFGVGRLLSASSQAAVGFIEAAFGFVSAFVLKVSASG